jgi:molybdopterin synthase sulfur carrier subunit
MYCSKMVCRIKIPGNLKDKTNGETIAEVKGDTVRDCIEALVCRFPDLKGEILDNQGRLLLKWSISINDQIADASDEMALPVKEGDLISLLPMIAGG